MDSSLPGEMKDWPEAQLKDGCFSNTCDYVRRLIRRDQEREDAIAALQQTVDQSLASGPARSTSAISRPACTPAITGAEGPHAGRRAQAYRVHATGAPPPERAARHHRPHPRRHIENMRLPGGKQDWLSKLNALDQ